MQISDSFKSLIFDHLAEGRTTVKQEKRECGWRWEETQLAPSVLKAWLFHFSIRSTWQVSIQNHGTQLISLSEESNMQSTFFNFGKLIFLWKEERKTNLHWQLFPLYLNVQTLLRVLSGVKSGATEHRGAHHSPSHPLYPDWSCILSMVSCLKTDASHYFVYVYAAQRCEHIPLGLVTKCNPIKITLRERHQPSIKRATVTRYRKRRNKMESQA